MSEISKLNNYNIKDKIARANHAVLVGEINGFVNEINAALEELDNKISNGGYTLPIATSNALGGIKTGYTTSGKNYKVQVDSKGNAYVNVPWTDTDTNTTYSQATSSTLGLVKIGYSENGKNYPVELNSSGQMFVNVPWTDTNTDTNTTYTFAGGTNSFTVTPSGGTAQTVTVTPSIAAASTSAAGLMSSADKTKLDGIAANANAYSLPLSASGTRGGIQIGYTASGANIPLQLSSEKAYVALTSTAITSALSYTPIKASDLSGYATKGENAANLTEAKSYTDTKIAALINSSPEALNTLDELAAALGDDPNFATTVSTKIGNNTSAIAALQTAVAGKLEKTTYEKSAELACGSNGKVCLGKFGAYDTNITIELNSTTSTTYHATIIIHSQNVVANGTGGTVGCYVYGDADNHVTPLISVFRPYGSASRQIEVYASLAGWSKNLVHVQAVALSDGGMTDVLTSVSEIPTAITGKTKVTPVNVLTTAFLGKTAKAASASVADSADAVAWANVSSKPSFATVATSGSYADLTNKPTIPTKTSQLTNDSGYIKSYTETDPTVPAWAKAASKPSYSYSEITGKPTLATVATSGSYNDLTNKPAIPSAYSLPLSASGTRGGIQIGYTASGANIPLQLSSEKAYVALTKSAVTSALGYTPLSTDGGTISGDLTLYAASGDSPKLRLQRGDNTGTVTDWNINVVSGALNFNTVSVSGSTAEKTVASIGYNGQFNVNGSFMENSVALSDKYQAKGSYASPSDVSTALSTAKSYTDAAVANLVDSSPDTLNTLNELAAALGDDPNFATTVAAQIGGKLGKTEKAADSDKLDGQDSSYYLNYNNLSNKPTIPTYTLGSFGVTATATELNYVDGVTSNIQTQLNGKLPVFAQSSYNANTAYDAGLYLIANGTNVPSGLPYGSLLTLPYRKGSGNTSPDFGTQIFIPNGDDSTSANSMFFRTSTSGQWNSWQEVAKKSDIPAYSVATASTAGLVKPVSVITKPTLNSVTTTAGKYYQVQMSNDGNMFVNVPWEAGSTSSNASTVSVTDTTPTSATTYYSLYSTGKSGNQTVRANKDLYFYDGGSYGYFNVGSSDSIGGLTLHYNNGKYVNLATATTLTANRNIYLPDADGTIITTGNFPTASSTTLGGVKSGGDVTINSGVITVNKAAKVKSIDTTSSMATCRVALLLDAAGRDNDELIKTADLKYNVSKKSLIENGVALSDKYGTYTHNIELETQNGYLWITVVDNHATAYNDTTFREKYPNGSFQATGMTWSWDGILVGQLYVGSSEFYGVVSYTDGYTTPVMDSMTFTVISDTVSN